MFMSDFSSSLLGNMSCSNFTKSFCSGLQDVIFTESILRPPCTFIPLADSVSADAIFSHEVSVELMYNVEPWETTIPAFSSHWFLLSLVEFSLLNILLSLRPL